MRRGSHDSLWKDVIWAFFADFMEMFAPHVARGLDMASVRLPNKEVFTDVGGGRQRTPDLVVEAQTVDGRRELILVHVEVQRRREFDVPARMWEYYTLLCLRHRVPVYPIVLYLSPGTGGITFEQYQESLFGDTLSVFRYLAIGLPDLSADEYLNKESPLGPAVSALMRQPKSDRVARTLRALERLASARVDDARKWLLGEVVGVYAGLSPSEKDELQALVSRSDARREMASMVTMWEKWGIEKGIEKGIEQGVQEGLVKGQQRMLRSVLASRFGDLPASVVERVASITDSEVLDAVAVRSVTAASLEDLGL